MASPEFFADEMVAASAEEADQAEARAAIRAEAIAAGTVIPFPTRRRAAA